MAYSLGNLPDSENLQNLLSFENDRQKLLKNRTMVRNALLNCIKANGFKQKGRSIFYTINNDIIGYFVLEHPSNRTYINFCIYPTYMPPMEMIHLMISKRISKVFSDPDIDISDYVSEKQLYALCQKLDGYITGIILPFINKINTNEKIEKELKCKERFLNTSIVATPIEFKYKIKMYTELSLHAYSDAINSANTFIALSDSPTYTELVRSSDRMEYQKFIDLANTKDDAYIDRIIAEWKKNNIEFFTGKRHNMLHDSRL